MAAGAGAGAPTAHAAFGHTRRQHYNHGGEQLLLAFSAAGIACYALYISLSVLPPPKQCQTCLLQPRHAGWPLATSVPTSPRPSPRPAGAATAAAALTARLGLPAQPAVPGIRGADQPQASRCESSVMLHLLAAALCACCRRHAGSELHCCVAALGLLACDNARAGLIRTVCITLTAHLALPLAPCVLVPAAAA